MTDALVHRLRAWLDQAPFDDVLSALRLVAEEARRRGVRRGYGSLCTNEEANEPIE